MLSYLKLTYLADSNVVLSENPTFLLYVNDNIEGPSKVHRGPLKGRGPPVEKHCFNGQSTDFTLCLKV